MSKIVFIGPCGGGKTPTNGASIKNHHILRFFDENRVDYTLIDTEYWRKNPWVLIRLLWFVLFAIRSTFIVSANNANAYRIISTLTCLGRKVIYWVIGGSIANQVKEGLYRATPYQKCHLILVEGASMKQTFRECGVEQVITVPNFKNIDSIPDKPERKDKKTHFVFLSRIIPEKGCDLIVEATDILCRKGYDDRFDVSFYGPFESSYQDVFLSKIKGSKNLYYQGFLDLRNEANYRTLAEYDVMLFPTYWHGEGFPGIIIDAYIAGLPIIASDWSMNKDIIEDRFTGFLITPRSTESLADRMAYTIDHSEQTATLVHNCRTKAMQYDTKYVLNQELLHKILS